MEKQVAVLIDGDNISAKYAESIKQEALQLDACQRNDMPCGKKAYE